METTEKGPLHTDRLATIKMLEAQGWQGPDASLEISLFEYDFAYRELEEPTEDGDDLLIIYRLTDRKGAWFDRVGIKNSMDLQREYNWVAWNSLYRTMGTTAKVWEQLPMWMCMYDLLTIHGYQNVFGSSHWEGFQIKTDNG